MAVIETNAPVPTVPTTETATQAAADYPLARTAFITPRALALVWFVAMTIVLAINPASAQPIQPSLLLTILGNAAAIGLYATLVVGAAKYRRTAAVGLGTGAFMLGGHFLCGFHGHLPMTGGIWITQFMLVAGATAVSGLALATRR